MAENLDFDKDYTCSVFETTIRIMGGLLSAYDLSGEAVLLSKARQLADRLLPAWSTPSGVPWHYLNLKSGQGHSPGWSGVGGTPHLRCTFGAWMPRPYPAAVPGAGLCSTSVQGSVLQGARPGGPGRRGRGWL